MISYLDASALVKLYIEEPGSAEVRDAVERADMLATSRITYVEVRAAAARRCREGYLSPSDHRRFCAALEKDWPHYAVVEVSAPVCRLAADVAERRALRAADALQLACALYLRGEVEEDLVFACFDARLSAAARAEGLAAA